MLFLALEALGAGVEVATTTEGGLDETGFDADGLNGLEAGGGGGGGGGWAKTDGGKIGAGVQQIGGGGGWQNIGGGEQQVGGGKANGWGQNWGVGSCTGVLKLEQQNFCWFLSCLAWLFPIF